MEFIENYSDQGVAMVLDGVNIPFPQTEVHLYSIDT